MPDQSEAPIDLLLRRIGQDFDGECHLTEAEARHIAEIIRLCEEALQECADDLKQEVRHRWCTQPDGTCHPALQHKFDRDMAPVNRAYAVLAQIKGQNP